MCPFTGCNCSMKERWDHNEDLASQNQPALRASRMFTKFFTPHYEESRCMSFIWMCAIITGMVYSFKLFGHTSCTSLGNAAGSPGWDFHLGYWILMRYEGNPFERKEYFMGFCKAILFFASFDWACFWNGPGVHYVYCYANVRKWVVWSLCFGSRYQNATSKQLSTILHYCIQISAYSPFLYISSFGLIQKF